MINYSKALLDIRAKLDWTQEKTAEYFHVAFATVNRWENEHIKPCKRHMQQLINLCKEQKIEVEKINKK